MTKSQDPNPNEVPRPNDQAPSKGGLLDIFGISLGFGAWSLAIQVEGQPIVV
jgi:hypothetical protein